MTENIFNRVWRMTPEQIADLLLVTTDHDRVILLAGCLTGAVVNTDKAFALKLWFAGHEHPVSLETLRQLTREWREQR